jgi:hypothetical protein
MLQPENSLRDRQSALAVRFQSDQRNLRRQCGSWGQALAVRSGVKTSERMKSGVVASNPRFANSYAICRLRFPIFLCSTRNQRPGRAACRFGSLRFGNPGSAIQVRQIRFCKSGSAIKVRQYWSRRSTSGRLAEPRHDWDSVVRGLVDPIPARAPRCEGQCAKEHLTAALAQSYKVFAFVG